jgi:pimeloyl-ACP methyl ester carboxylesterase
MEAMADVIPTAATGPIATPLQKAFIREMLMGQDPEGYVANCRAIESAVPPKYGDVRAPMLVIAGEVDKSAPLEGCKFILEKLGSKEKRLEVLKGVGHWHCIESPEQVGALVKGFCDGLQI